MVVTTTAGAAVTWSPAQADTSVTMVGIGYPAELSTSRTETISVSPSKLYFGNNSLVTTRWSQQITWDTMYIYYGNWYEFGFRNGDSITVTDAGTFNGTYTISSINNYSGYTAYSQIVLDANSWSSAGIDYDATVSKDIVLSDGDDCFNPQTITGHKGRLFAGGVKEYPTYLFYSVSRFFSQYYWDRWRDRINEDDGSGYIDLQDKIIALVGDWQDKLIIFCENKIMALTGDDPGFDILTPSQVLVYHPTPVTMHTGCVGPNAWCEADGDIFFMSRSGLQRLKLSAEGGVSRYQTESLPVSDIVNDILLSGNSKAISMQYLKDLNLILINCAISEGTNDSILAYNLSNKSWSKWTFADGSEPNCLFNLSGPQIDPNEDDIPVDSPNPYDTVWMGSQDGKLWAFTKAYCYDRDYEDPNSNSDPNIAISIITAKLNMGNPWQSKLFRRAVVLASPQINYTTASGGAYNLYYKIDDGSWSSAVTKTFTTHTDTAGTAIDYYEFADSFGLTGVKNDGHTIQYKITTSGLTSRFGLSLMGIMTEWEPLQWEADI